ncbi:putative oxidoreductase [Mucilaginibacter pineti]|uniref:Putative oxidoreductase n=1 Tax=Mucilaginibacter pineti TaxID=1391627 RepID=A0A1G7JCL9_9SPHI|nr:DoxX family protein [Mucilaginibacter pineti]SDF22219.1 putative oxidoreductase [Mucilaginibacter pineti]
MKFDFFACAGKDYRQYAPIFLRLAIGFGFTAHSWAKLTKGPEHFAQLLETLHVPFPQITAWVSILTELLGGMALLAGLFVSLWSIPLIATMLVAMFTIHIHYGYSSVKTIGLTPHGPVFGPPGYEINLLYIAGLISLMITGAGRYSLDAYMTSGKQH